MADSASVLGSIGLESAGTNPLTEPCVMIIFGASGDLTKRLLVPALYNLKCDHLLSDRFAVLGTASSGMDTPTYRERLSGDDGILAYHTRKEFERAAWDDLIGRFHYRPGTFDDPAHFEALRTTADELASQYQTGGNILFYFAVAPRFFGGICEMLANAGFKEGPGWRRIIVEKPFGTDLQSARDLNEEVLRHWEEDQIYRVDHYLGKETVQNLLAFRFSNGMFEPLWNKNFIDNIQFTVSESVDVQGRGGYYDHSGVLRDMMQNHMFQMLAYLCMEPPGSFQPDAIRNEKAKLLESVRVYTPEEVARNAVRGQYGPSYGADGKVEKPGYRQEKDVNPNSNTETFAAAKLHIDNWRWEGVPIYLRSGKALWKRSTEIVVQFKRAPIGIFRGTDVDHLSHNRLVFHIQPYQGIELLFQAKVPGPTLRLQNVDMVFSYGDAFKASRYTGYEVMIYSCTRGDATLFSRGDLVDAAWRIAQPILDHWSSTPAEDFPNYSRNSWGPKAANQLIARDGRRWFEVVTRDVLEQSPLFADADPLLLNAVILALRPRAVERGETIVKLGEMATEMFVICRGEVEILDADEQVVGTLREGDCFGEVGVLLRVPRTATVRAKTLCDLFVLDKDRFGRILKDHPQFADAICKVAKDRYDLSLCQNDLLNG
ncbi:MAG: glucose-6-phosphate dehydrogenase [Bdellovibrionales bacterium]|nr:glucose-6-phosphate dehydrogenase [Bdellovibrionales bacterium]